MFLSGGMVGLKHKNTDRLTPDEPYRASCICAPKPGAQMKRLCHRCLWNRAPNNLSVYTVQHNPEAGDETA